MLKTEFEKIAGYEVSFNDYYNIIEPMYMSVDLTKTQFVKILDRKRFALKSKEQLLKEIKNLAKLCKKNCDHFYDSKSEEKLYNLIKELKERFDEDIRVEQKKTQRGCYYPASLNIYKGEYFIQNVILTI